MLGHLPYWTPPTYRCQNLMMAIGINDIQGEIMCMIYKKLHEIDRRELKHTCRQMNEYYCAFVSMTKNNPPQNVRLYHSWIYRKPCNGRQKYEGPSNS